MSDDSKQVIDDFRSVVNMTAAQLTKWLDTDESKRVGYKGEGEGESVGHHSGRRIIEILGKKRTEYTDTDRQHMAKVVGYIHRHLAQRPDGDIKETPWRFSLMNWGHDPIKKPKAKPKRASKAQT